MESPSEAVLAIRPGRPWPYSCLAYQNGAGHPMIPTYTTPFVLPKICSAFDWPTQMKIPRTARGHVVDDGARQSLTVSV